MNRIDLVRGLQPVQFLSRRGVLVKQVQCRLGSGRKRGQAGMQLQTSAHAHEPLARRQCDFTVQDQALQRRQCGGVDLFHPVQHGQPTLQRQCQQRGQFPIRVAVGFGSSSFKQVPGGHVFVQTDQRGARTGVAGDVRESTGQKTFPHSFWPHDAKIT